MLELKNFVSPDQVLFDLDGETYEDIMVQMIDPLVKNKIILDPALFLDDLLERESHLSTVVQDPGVAFPHAYSQSATRLGICVAIPKNRKIFLEGYSEPVQAFFMLAIPRDIPTLHLTMLDTLNRFVKDDVKFPKFIKQRTTGLTARMLSAYKLKN